MPRIAQIEINVNAQMKIQIENSKDGQSEVKPVLFDPGWGAECIDPVTGKKAKLYDHVPRSMKFSGGIQIWILIPRYSLEGGGLFRVLPSNLCVYKHYVVEEIQDALDEAIGEMTESEKTSSEGKLQQQLDGSEDASVRPCDRTKWLWLLWFFRNLLQIESVLRMIHFVNATMTGAGESTFLKILNRTDYLMELRLKEQDDWLKVVIQTAWNSGQPLIPLRDMETMQEVWTAIAVHPIPE